MFAKLRPKRRYVLMIVIFLIGLTRTSEMAARPRKAWTYASLWSGSDLVCIGVVRSTRVVKNTEFFPKFLEGLESEIQVIAAMKGDESSKRIAFVHFRYRSDAPSLLGNGPSFAKLSDAPMEVGIEKERNTRTFLFFLKRREDGRFGPTTGDNDAEISVAQVIGHTDDFLFPNK